MNATEFLDENPVYNLREEGIYQNEQYGKKVIHASDLDDAQQTPVVYLLGCNDIRGNYEDQEKIDIPHTKRIREVFYQYFDWHADVRVVDLGDVRTGYSSADTKAAIEQIIQAHALRHFGQRKSMTIVFGGSGDQIAGAYNAFKKKDWKTNIAVVNSTLPILPNHTLASHSYLLDLLIEEHSFLKHYSHLAFQSYLNSVDLLTNLDKFSFENIRLGQLREDIDHQEPLFRASDLVSFDLNALAPTAYPLFHQSPMGLSGEEACRLMQFAGMSTRTNVIHLAGYDARKDIYNYYAMSMAQMMWYAIEGFARYPKDEEPNAHNQHLFERFDMRFADYEVAFYHSSRSNRWWMMGANKEYIPCDYKDYEEAQHNKVSEKWLRSIDK